MLRGEESVPTETSLVSVRAFLQISAQSMLSTFLRFLLALRTCRREEGALGIRCDNFLNQPRLATSARASDNDEGV